MHNRRPSASIAPLACLIAAVIAGLFGGSFTQAEDIADLKARAEKGDANAQIDLAACYINGESVKGDAAEAVNWLLKAANQGSARAQNNLGILYLKSYGKTKDRANAVQSFLWISKAAAQGYPDAQHNLGAAYRDGFGAPRNLDKAVMWFRKAAEQGAPAAQCSLGECYREGK
jgi:TPR repeat protein